MDLSSILHKRKPVTPFVPNWYYSLTKVLIEIVYKNIEQHVTNKQMTFIKLHGSFDETFYS